MLPCKGCIYYSGALFGICRVHAEPGQVYDELRGIRYSNPRGHKLIEDERGRDGECGPDRKLFKTQWMDLKENWKEYLKVLAFLAVMVGGVWLVLFGIFELFSWIHRIV